jgi:hypothetical protein
MLEDFASGWTSNDMVRRKRMEHMKMYNTRLGDRRRRRRQEPVEGNEIKRLLPTL